MARRSVFYSFHFDNDVMRVQQVRNIGALEDNEPVSPSAWEMVRRSGNAAIERWIDENMNYRQCVVVLIGSETASRPWVKYEIKKAWDEKRGLFGIYIHNLKCPRTGTCAKGANPFDNWNAGANRMSSLVTCYDPPAANAYNVIAANMENWVERAIAERK
jgi:antiphage defense system Thoeris ThsB-like protein